MSGDPLSVAIGTRALDGLNMRMAAIAHNLANAGTPRFQAVAVDFEKALRTAAAQGRRAVAGVRFDFVAGQVHGPNDERRIDLLVADAAQTAMRYSALVDILGQRLALRRTALGKS